MPKERKTITVRIPTYKAPRLKWRRRIQKAVIKAQKKRDVSYTPSDRIEVLVQLYFDGSALTIHDIDNRMKDVFDALQGRIGGSKKIRPTHPVIPNDRQIWRLVAEKSLRPKQNPRGEGQLIIRKLRAR